MSGSDRGALAATGADVSVAVGVDVAEGDGELVGRSVALGVDVARKPATKIGVGDGSVNGVLVGRKLFAGPHAIALKVKSTSRNNKGVRMSRLYRAAIRTPMCGCRRELSGGYRT